jgi:hypothetical protein
MDKYNDESRSNLGNAEKTAFLYFQALRGKLLKV